MNELERTRRLRSIDIGESDQIELALLAHVLQRRRLLLERYCGVIAALDQSQVHKIKPLHAK